MERYPQETNIIAPKFTEALLKVSLVITPPIHHRSQPCLKLSFQGIWKGSLRQGCDLGLNDGLIKPTNSTALQAPTLASAAFAERHTCAMCLAMAHTSTSDGEAMLFNTKTAVVRQQKGLNQQG
jgi:hypothetical protein